MEMKSKPILVWLKLNPDEEQSITGFTKDMRNIGHLGTGDFQVTIKDHEDFERAKQYIQKSYKLN